MTQVEPLTRRERQREATFAEIVEVSRALLAEGAELSLRAVAARMGMTAPALYRYVSNYQALVDLVAYEIDQANTAAMREVIATTADDDPAARLFLSVTEFRAWALGNPGEFTLIFGNPIAEVPTSRRELITSYGSCLLLTDLIYDLWTATRFPIRRMEDLPAIVQEILKDPLIPADVDKIPLEHRGLVWVYDQGWTQLFGAVALEAMGHMDPRLIESGEMYLDVLRRFAPVLGLAEDWPRLEGLIRDRLSSA